MNFCNGNLLRRQTKQHIILTLHMPCRKRFVLCFLSHNPVSNDKISNFPYLSQSEKKNVDDILNVLVSENIVAKEENVTSIFSSTINVFNNHLSRSRKLLGTCGKR